MSARAPFIDPAEQLRSDLAALDSCKRLLSHVWVDWSRIPFVPQLADKAIDEIDRIAAALRASAPSQKKAGGPSK